MQQHDGGQNRREDSIPHLLLEVLPVVMRVMSAQMRETPQGVTSAHMPVLAVLEVEPRTLSELAEIMSVSGPTMSNTITALETRGWIVRDRSAADRRLVHIALTEAGRTALHDSIHEMEHHLGALVERAALANEEQAALVEGLHLLRRLFVVGLTDLKHAFSIPKD